MRQSISIVTCSILLAASALIVAQRTQGPAPPGTAARAGECPPGQTLVRIGRCEAPDTPPPSIVDYRPKSTLVVEEHPVPRAKFPVVDIHSHQSATPENMARLVREMDALNLRVLNNLSGGSGERLRQNVDAIRKSPYRDRFTVFANLNFAGFAAGWGAKAAAQLEQDVRNGAIGLKIFKDLGMTTRKADGSRIAIDDPELDPVWAAAGRLNVPVLIHTGEPPAFFDPPDYTNERWLELALFPSRRNYSPNQVKFDQLIAERDRMFAKHPKTQIHRGALRLPRPRPQARGRVARQAAECVSRGGRRPVRLRPSAAERPRRFSRSIRIACCSARTPTPPRSSRTTGVCSRPPMNISITTATITRSGSCTA